MDGTKINVARNTIALTIAKNAIAISIETALAIKLTMGTPTTIPADTPIKTLETAFEWWLKNGMPYPPRVMAEKVVS